MKKSILFVEDDPVQLQLFELLLSTQMTGWEVTCLGDSQQALELLEGRAFDVVISDWLMPGVSGAALMKRVRDRRPGAARIIVSVLSNQEEVARALADTHQFIPKPFDLKRLRDTLEQIGSLDAYLKDEKVVALISRLGELPSYPTLYLKIMQQLASPEASIEVIAGIISEDMGMTAKMLQIANSAVIALAHRVHSPFEAVEYLGLGTVRSLVLSAHIFSSYDRVTLGGYSTERLWSHALRTASIARLIVQLESGDPEDAEDAYVAGMLHDAGKLMLASCLPEEFERAASLAARKRISFPEAELEVYGTSHAAAAAYLLGLWGLPSSIVEAVAFHHEPSRSGRRVFGPLAAVHAADVLEQELSKGETHGLPVPLDTEYLAELNLQDHLRNWRAEAVRQLNSPRRH
ncbi:MAG: response regulator [Verrucomicrobiota bacterium]